MLRHLDLFSGIGGFALAARMVGGYETVAFCEIEPYCQAVLRKHWPLTPIYDDVRELTGTYLGPIDIITGGFPCQDISVAGHRAGIGGERSGLWSEIVRLTSEIRPRFLLVENVSALLGGGLERVLGDLAQIGYDAEWECIPAAAVGAPHIRDRVWILAHPGPKHGGDARRHHAGCGCSYLFPERDDRGTSERREDRELIALVPGIHPRVVADWWRTQSRVDRSANGLSNGMERCCALGNAIVPQVAAIFLQAIKESMTLPTDHP